MIPRIAFYVRVSSDEQTERATAKNQVDFLRKKYQPNFEPDSLEPMAFAGMFVDDGQSGAIDLQDRPEGGRLLALVRARDVDLVVVYRLDRLGRRLEVLLDAHDDFQRHDVAILSATEPFDTRTPIGQFLFQLLGSMAQLERETIKERFVMGRDRVAREGKFLNGPVPIGYDLDTKTYRLVPSQRFVSQLGCTEADMVRSLFERAADGESAAALTTWLRARGVPSTKRYIRRDGVEKEEVFAQWNAVHMQDLIHEPTYYGQRRLRYSGSVITQDVPPLVERDVWDRANATLTGRLTKFNSGQNGGYVYLLSGKLFCTECGWRMVGNYQGARNSMYYVCSSARSNKARRTAESCTKARYHDGWALEQFVLDAIDEYVVNPEAALKILREQVRERQGSSAQHEDQIKRLRSRLADYERGKVSLLMLVRQGAITHAEYLDQTAKAAEEAMVVRQELELLEADGALASIIETRLLESVQTLNELRAEWQQARTEGDRVALRAMVQRTLQEMRLTPDGAARMTFVFSSPVSRENNREHYQLLWRDTIPVTLELGRSLRAAS